ncbi:MAG: hypothetical protein O2960_24820 [Verrucomicrobia bacterium]|nr:hypothetical protein [Verrucomicrobiota bacterium]
MDDDFKVYWSKVKEHFEYMRNKRVEFSKACDELSDVCLGAPGTGRGSIKNKNWSWADFEYFEDSVFKKWVDQKKGVDRARLVKELGLSKEQIELLGVEL